MIEQEVNKASIALKEEKERLVAFLRDRMSTIVFPENQTLIEVKQSSATVANERLPKLLLGGGVIAFVIGLCLRTSHNTSQALQNDDGNGFMLGVKIVLLVLGIIACIVGAYMILSKKNGNFGENVRKQENLEFDFSKMANTIYKSLEGAHAHITKEWDSFLGQQNAFLSSVIRLSDCSEEKKAELIDKVTKRSLIEFSMMDAYTELNTVSRAKDVQAMKRVMDTIVEKYEKEIARACEEQLSTYASL